MKALSFLFLAGTAAGMWTQLSVAQTGQLELFADPAASSCALVHTPYIESVYVFQTAGAATTGVGWFSAPKPDCWNATWVADNAAPGLKTGSSQTSITVILRVCRPLPALILEIQYLAGGTSSPCCKYVISASEYIDCSFQEWPMTIGPRSVTINPDESCPCQSPLATEPSTWGRVKALYR
jgi:hypothetical protein